MKNVTTASDGYLVYFYPITIVSNILMRNGTYPLMFISRVWELSFAHKELEGIASHQR